MARLDANDYNGSDNRNDLTEPDPPDCPDCGAAYDQPCKPECGCVHCRARELADLKESRRARSSTDEWTYTTATFRQKNGSTANQ